MKMLALVLVGVIVGLGLVVLPMLGSPSFFSGSATQYGAGDGKNTSGSAILDGNTTVPAAEVEGNSVYRSLSQSPAGSYGLPAIILAIGVVVAAFAYLLIRKTLA
jgi:hypothetical protein